MPSLSSLALAFLTRSECLLAYSGLRFPSSTYFMATSTSCGSFCAKTLQLYAFRRGAPMPLLVQKRGSRGAEIPVPAHGGVRILSRVTRRPSGWNVDRHQRDDDDQERIKRDFRDVETPTSPHLYSLLVH